MPSHPVSGICASRKVGGLGGCCALTGIEPGTSSKAPATKETKWDFLKTNLVMGKSTSTSIGRARLRQVSGASRMQAEGERNRGNYTHGMALHESRRVAPLRDGAHGTASQDRRARKGGDATNRSISPHKDTQGDLALNAGHPRHIRVVRGDGI